MLTGNGTKSLNLASPSVLDGGSFVQPVWGKAGRPGTVPSAVCHTHFSSDVLGSFSCPRLLPFFLLSAHVSVGGNNQLNHLSVFTRQSSFIYI